MALPRIYQDRTNIYLILEDNTTVRFANDIAGVFRLIQHVPVVLTDDKPAPRTKTPPVRRTLKAPPPTLNSAALDTIVSAMARKGAKIQ